MKKFPKKEHHGINSEYSYILFEKQNNIELDKKDYITFYAKKKEILDMSSIQWRTEDNTCRLLKFKNYETWYKGEVNNVFQPEDSLDDYIDIMYNLNFITKCTIEEDRRRVDVSIRRRDKQEMILNGNQERFVKYIFDYIDDNKSDIKSDNFFGEHISAFINIDV